MKDTVRDSTLGQLFNHFSGGKLLPYEDQRPDYEIPTRYLLRSLQPLSTDKEDLSPPSPLKIDTPGTQTATLVNAEGICQRLEMVEMARRVDECLEKCADEKEVVPDVKHVPVLRKEQGYVTVGWNGPDDPDNPNNWSRRKKYFVTGMICLLTASMYAGSAVFSPAVPGIMEEYHVSEVAAVAGLSAYVFAYGCSPLILTSLQDVASVGRNPGYGETVYIACSFLFPICLIPIIRAPNIYCLLIFRFITGFLAGPSLATGGASLEDIWPPGARAYAIVTWALSASTGPILGPLAGSFPAMKLGWRWPIYILLILSSITFVVLFCFLPETLEGAILRKRAQRLRKLTGNMNLRSVSEVEEEGETPLSLTWINFKHTCRLSLEPAVMFSNVYLGFVYSIFYLWFEAFPFVFARIYGFNLGEQALPFIGMLVSGIITYILYVLYNLHHIDPRKLRPDYTHEVRLEVGIFGSIVIPISLFIFGWTAHYHTHWMGPTIGASLYFPAIFLLFQSILCYISDSYSRYTGAVMASNDFARSSVASIFPLFGVRFFTNLGLGGGLSLLAGISILMIPFICVLRVYGARLRSGSKWTLEKDLK